MEKQLRTALGKLGMEHWVVSLPVNTGVIMPLMVRRIPKFVHKSSLARMQARTRQQSREGVYRIQLPEWFKVRMARGASVAGKRDSQHVLFSQNMILPKHDTRLMPSLALSCRLADDMRTTENLPQKNFRWSRRFVHARTDVMDRRVFLSAAAPSSMDGA